MQQAAIMARIGDALQMEDAEDQDGGPFSKKNTKLRGS
jgi:hypothetical protein